MKTVIIAVATTLATTFAVSRFAPRLEARSVRIKAAWAARDTFSGHVLTILSATGRLEDLESAEMAEPLRGRMQGEQSRWEEQVDESTRYLIDHAEQYVLTYPSKPLDLHGLLIGFVVAARGLWLSELPVPDRARHIRALAAPVHGIFFANASYRLRHLADDRRRLQELLQAVNDPTSPPPVAAPAPAGTTPPA
ncbi:hypothetical protein [Streptomyces avermitilis]|uniref:hypothetical protein n=1 Tax=Streptomyces avermitilis TaxID=33903 RepID=UPI003682DEBF